MSKLRFTELYKDCSEIVLKDLVKDFKSRVYPPKDSLLDEETKIIARALLDSYYNKISWEDFMHLIREYNVGIL